MTAGELDIIIGANVDEALAAFKKLGYEMKKTEQAASKVAQKTTKDFTGLSRVIQDLPFGFIGIQNNITQLLPAAGGLGLAISAITSAIAFAQVGLSNWTRGFGQSKEEIDEFAKSLVTAEAGARKTGAQLSAYVAIARDNTKSLNERNFALGEANKLMGEHGQKLTLININTKEVTETLGNYTEALIKQAIAEKLSGNVADLYIKKRDAAKAYGVSVKELADFQNTYQESINPFKAAQLLNLWRKTFVTANAYKDVTKSLGEETVDFNKITEETIALLTKVGKKEDELKDKKFPKDRFQWLIPDFNFQVIPKLSEKMDTLQKQLQGKLNIKPLLLHFELPDLSKGENIKRAIDATLGLIQDQITKSFVAIGESLGNALVGAKNPFAPVLAVLSEGLKTLGKAYIEIGVQALIAKKALSLLMKSPYLTIAAGIALVALGQILQSKAQNVKAFATGGVVTRPTLALVGEQGPERITPLGYEGMAGRALRVEIEGYISNNVIRLANRRAEAVAFNTF